MNIKIREALEADKSDYVEFAIKLSKFHRSNHKEECKYDDYNMVLEAIKEQAHRTFDSKNEDCLILIACIDNKAVGYALAKIYSERRVLDSGTGRIGLFDELYVDDSARGFGIGKKLLDEVIIWFKSRNIKRIKLRSYSWNTKARKLYEDNGFTQYVVSYEKFI